MYGLSYTISPDSFPAYSLSIKLVGEFAENIHMLFSMSLTRGTILDSCKLANIFPVFKRKGYCTSVKSYRPISLTNAFFKSMERLITIKIIDFLEKNNLISCRVINLVLGVVAPPCHN